MNHENHDCESLNLTINDLENGIQEKESIKTIEKIKKSKSSGNFLFSSLNYFFKR